MSWQYGFAKGINHNRVKGTYVVQSVSVLSQRDDPAISQQWGQGRSPPTHAGSLSARAWDIWGQG